MHKFGLYIILFVCHCGFALGQNFQRNAEEIAMKQTIMLDREVNLDSTQLSRVYQIHLHYARLSFQETTRAQMIERMTKINEELKQVLTAQQYEIFMNKKVDTHPHGYHHNLGRIFVNDSTSSPNKQDSNKPL